MRRIQQVVDSAIEQKEVLRAARAWRALRRWGEVVGASLATKSAPDGYDKGTVFVAVSGSAWAVELRMRKDEILRRLQEASGEPSLFQKLRFGVRTFDNTVVHIEPILDSRAPNQEPTDTSIRAIGERLLEKRKDAGGD